MPRAEYSVSDVKDIEMALERSGPTVAERKKSESEGSDDVCDPEGAEMGYPEPFEKGRVKLVEQPFLLRFKVVSWGIALGITSQAVLYANLASNGALGFTVPAALRLAFWFFGLAVLVLLDIVYVAKSLYFGDAIRREIFHPLRVNFFFAPMLATQFLCIAAPKDMWSDEVVTVIWFPLLVFQVLMQMHIYWQWLYSGARSINNSNPTYQIAVVGNFVSGILGAKLGYKQLTLFFFSVGLLYQLTLFITLYQRLGSSKDARPSPILFLFIAPPAAASIALSKYFGYYQAGSQVLLFVSIFIFLFLMRHILSFIKTPFGLVWWATTFPLTALALGALEYSSVKELSTPFWIGFTIVLAFSSTAIVLVLTVCTCVSLYRGTLYPFDPVVATKYRELKLAGVDASELADRLDAASHEQGIAGALLGGDKLEEHDTVYVEAAELERLRKLDLHATAIALARSVDIRDRTYRRKKYASSFLGSECVTAMIKLKQVQQHQSALALGALLMTEGFMHHVTDTEPFKDAKLFYCFSRTIMDQLEDERAAAGGAADASS